MPLVKDFFTGFLPSLKQSIQEIVVPWGILDRFKLDWVGLFCYKIDIWTSNPFGNPLTEESMPI